MNEDFMWGGLRARLEQQREAERRPEAPRGEPRAVAGAVVALRPNAAPRARARRDAPLARAAGR